MDKDIQIMLDKIKSVDNKCINDKYDDIMNKLDRIDSIMCSIDSTLDSIDESCVRINKELEYVKKITDILGKYKIN